MVSEITENNFLNNLNESQQKATLYNEGASLIIAGAGSGKTRVLTYKIAYLLTTGIQPYRILALTFTNKAANEMKERIAQIVGKKITWMGTFHSVFSKILRQHAELIGFTPQFTIYDSSDSKSLVKNIIKTMNLDEKIYKPSNILSKISMLKNHLISPTAYEADYQNQQNDYLKKIPEFYNIYKQYVERCKHSNVMDFDDLLFNTNLLFSSFPDVLKQYQELFSFILIDEYQDTNYSQHLIVKALAAKHQKVCAVGDDAQSIYSFRGANIDNILTFQRDFPNCKLFKLEQNYRSTKNIVDAANSLIEKNNHQIRKTIFSKNKRGNLIELINSYSDFDEAASISSKIRQILRLNDYNYSDFAVLYRTNSQSRVLEDAFRKNNIPYKIYGGISFYQRKEIKDILAYCRLTINKNDEEALRRIINYPARGIGDTTQIKLFNAAHSYGTSVFEVAETPTIFNVKINSGTQKKLLDFTKKIEEYTLFYQANDAYASVEKIIKESGIITDILTDDTPENISKKENIDEFLNMVYEFCDRKANEGESNISLTDFLAEVALFTDQDNESEEEQNKVTLMTVHAAKGLEFKNVFIAGLEEQLFPSALCQTPNELEEERRLLYVAITRAEDNCILSYAKSRFRNGQTQFSNPSRFIKDIDSQFLHQQQEYTTFYGRETTNTFKEYRSHTSKIISIHSPQKNIETTNSTPISTNNDEIQVGSKVIHALFGKGIVVDLEGHGDERKAKVEFQTRGTKQLLLKYAKLTITE
ncbi:MAG: UvrD-helicase domain-containing protein [Paludibacteraceae bacterium]|nr:UvrD-helicase domain-containing protein [Paludibacteraceae bacterium]